MDFIYYDLTKTLFLKFSIKVLVLMCLRAAIAKARDESYDRRHGPLRIIGGRDAKPGEFSYVVRLETESPEIIIDGVLKSRRKNHHMCTVSVLSPIVSLTAAHCYSPVDEGSYVIRYGSQDGKPSENDRFSNVLNWFVAPSARTADNTLMKGDLALLRTEPIVLRTYARLSARDHHTMYGQRVFTLGYGGTNHSTGNVYDTLKLKKPLQVVSAMLSECHNHIYLFPSPYTYPVLCVVKPCGRHAAICGGDSGGPVLHASGVLGITSMSPVNSCQMITDSVREHTINLIIPLSSDIDWIADTIADMKSA